MKNSHFSLIFTVCEMLGVGGIGAGGDSGIKGCQASNTILRTLKRENNSNRALKRRSHIQGNPGGS